MSDTALILILGVVSIVSALGLLFSRNAVYAALFLVVNFGVAAAIYLLLNAPFLAVVQVTVYAGAIMVLFVFVIMLLGAEKLPKADAGAQISAPVFVVIASASVLVVSIAYALFWRPAPGLPAGTALVDSSPAAIGLRLFGDYSFPFEVISLVLLAAMVGAVVLTRDTNKSA
jgi:NADH-quinone oxidoreductase subunit J